MPTVADLERLQALLRRLTPLSEVERGELIRADDWNAVVGALIEVLRSVLANSAGDSLAAHEHLDQVTIGWLDPRLRALIEKGPLAEPTAVTRLDSFERRLVQSSERLTSLDQSIRETRNLASEVATREERRDTDLGDIRRTLAAIPDAREDMLGLRDTLRGIQEDVRRSVEIGDGLVVNGQPFDATAFDQRLRHAEELRDRLTSPDGTLFDANAQERRLVELINTFTTQEQLQDILDRPVTLPADQLLTLEDNLADRVNERFSADLGRVSTDLRAEMTQRFAGVDAIVGRSIGDATPNITENVLTAVRGEIDTRVGANRTELLNTLEQRLAASTSGVMSSVEERLAGLETRVTASLTDLVTSRLNDAVAPLRADITRLDASTRQNSDAISRIDRNQVDLTTRVEANARTEEQARRALQTSLTAEMDRRQQLNDRVLDTRFTEFESRLRDQVNLAVSDATASLLPQLEQLATTAARRESQIVLNQVRGEVREIAREEVTVVVSDVSRSFQEEVNRSNQVLTGLVTQEVRRQTSNLPDLIRNELNTGTVIRTNTVLRPGGGSILGPGG